jgi:hypothetical protein
MLSIQGTKVADGYGCTLLGNRNFLYEKKSKRHITKAISQLQETAEKIIDKNLPLDEAFIICERISKPETSFFQRKRIKGQNGNFLYDKNLGIPVELKHMGKVIPVQLFYKSEC